MRKMDSASIYIHKSSCTNQMFIILSKCGAELKCPLLSCVPYITPCMQIEGIPNISSLLAQKDNTLLKVTNIVIYLLHGLPPRPKHPRYERSFRFWQVDHILHYIPWAQTKNSQGSCAINSHPHKMIGQILHRSYSYYSLLFTILQWADRCIQCLYHRSHLKLRRVP